MTTFKLQCLQLHMRSFRSSSSVRSTFGSPTCYFLDLIYKRNKRSSTSCFLKTCFGVPMRKEWRQCCTFYFIAFLVQKCAKRYVQGHIHKAQRSAPAHTFSCTLSQTCTHASSQTFRLVWPVHDKVQARDFKKLVFTLLQQLEKEDNLPPNTVRQSHIQTCSGERYIHKRRRSRGAGG